MYVTAAIKTSASATMRVAKPLPPFVSAGTYRSTWGAMGAECNQPGGVWKPRPQAVFWFEFGKIVCFSQPFPAGQVSYVLSGA